MITSLDNKKVKDWTKLNKKKYRESEYLLFTEDAINAAKEKGYLRTLIYTGDIPFDFPEAYEVSKEVLNKISEGRDLSYIGVAGFIQDDNAWEKRILILDHLQDPLNIGRIMETAVLFGFDSIILSKESADIYHEKALEASHGALYSLHIHTGDLLEEIEKCKKRGFSVYATGLRGQTKDLYEVEESEKMAFILGNEGSGVREEVMDASDATVKIDMANIDSLNVAMAAAVIAYHFRNV